ncbi:MAG: hypothetical protein IT184_05950 [Acidobacteria bacterium]|nr:hypothetical protein [Acidobacteriota bacterium]
MIARRPIGWLAAMMVAAVVSAACGYALAGRGNALPASITTIGVPPFVNHSSIGDVDRVVATAVREEFQTKGRYQVRPDAAGVDGLLTATISSVTLQPTAFSDDRRPTAFAVVVLANVEFKHVTDDNRVLWANPVFRVTDDYQLASGSSGDVDPSALFSQNTQALDRLARKFAREVVTSIFEAF